MARTQRQRLLHPDQRDVDRAVEQRLDAFRRRAERAPFDLVFGNPERTDGEPRHVVAERAETVERPGTAAQSARAPRCGSGRRGSAPEPAPSRPRCGPAPRRRGRRVPGRARHRRHRPGRRAAPRSPAPRHAPASRPAPALRRARDRDRSPPRRTGRRRRRFRLSRRRGGRGSILSCHSPVGRRRTKWRLVSVITASPSWLRVS